MQSEAEASLLLRGYGALEGVYDELVDSQGQPRPHARAAAGLLDGLTPEAFQRCQSLAELSLVQQGVTFSVYSDQRGTEKVMPVCLVPRVMAAAEWARLERGLVQRLAALELFLDDVYGDQHTMREGVVPGEMVNKSKSFEPRLRGIKPAGGVRIHIAGVDLIRDPSGTLRVLEDNLRTPSGVSYVLENRQVTKRVFQTPMESAGVRRVDDYPSQLAEALRSVSPVDPEESTVVVLTPGPFNSAYFEHSFLARSMGLELVEASDLVVDGDDVFVRTTMGPRRVHVIYRRTDDAFLDPEFFRPDSLLGVPGLMRAWAKGRVALANAPGNGVADDKAIYPFVPDLIRFFLKEEPIIEQVPTFVCARREDRDYVVEHLSELVVKAVDEAGGYGMLMGPQATAAERERFRGLVLAEPRKYIAQHRIELSTCPTWVPERMRLEPRRVDLRPFCLASRSSGGGVPSRWVLPGGLTRVALREGSYVVNSSQGGGSKDTWVQMGEYMISRVADHCFWVGRYLDRAESTARLLQVTRALAFDAEMPTQACWRPVVTVSGQFPDFIERFGDPAAGSGDVVQRYMTWAPENPVSIRNSIRGARESARSIREVLSLDIWQATNELYLWFVGEEAQKLYANDRDEIYRQVRRSTQLNLGLVRSTMLHDTPMDILWLGVLLERIGQTARILDMHHYLLDESGASDGSGKHQIVQTALWLSLLRTCSGFEAFMRVNKGRVNGSDAVEFLLFEERFPRSLRYCVRSALGLMRRIWPAPAASAGQAPLRRLAALDAWLERAQDDLGASSIHDLLTHVVDEVGMACGEVRHGMSGATAADDAAEKVLEAEKQKQEQSQVAGLAPPTQQ